MVVLIVWNRAIDCSFRRKIAGLVSTWMSTFKLCILLGRYLKYYCDQNFLGLNASVASLRGWKICPLFVRIILACPVMEFKNVIYRERYSRDSPCLPLRQKEPFHFASVAEHISSKKSYNRILINVHGGICKRAFIFCRCWKMKFLIQCSSLTNVYFVLNFHISYELLNYNTILIYDKSGPPWLKIANWFNSWRDTVYG